MNLNNNREWNAEDFYGKYHLSRFSNKETPVPGTQVKIERDYAQNRAREYKKLEDDAIVREKRNKEMLQVKSEGAEFRTKVYFDAVIGIPIEKIEQVLYEKEKILHFVPKPLNEQKDIDKFILNVELNRHHYIGFAVNNGYQSINYQHPQTGDSALHIAVRRGNVETVEELLKYKADPELKNRLGNNPVHDAWFFWKKHYNRTKEERETQENKTCDILLKIFSYGGYVDALDLDQQTALHIACRLGPNKAVKTILSFKADYNLRTKFDKLPSQIALEHGHVEIYKLLQAWNSIRHHLIHLDFHCVWTKFLQDPESVINENKSADKILNELEMDKNIRKLERGGDDAGVMIDDPLLTAAYKEYKKASLEEQIPKPWDATWNDFVKKCKDQGMVDMVTKYEQMGTKQKGIKKIKTNNIRKIERNPLPDRPVPEPRIRRDLDALSSMSLGSIKEENEMNNMINQYKSDSEDEEEKEEKEILERALSRTNKSNSVVLSKHLSTQISQMQLEKQTSVVKTDTTGDEISNNDNNKNNNSSSSNKVQMTKQATMGSKTAPSPSHGSQLQKQPTGMDYLDKQFSKLNTGASMASSKSNSPEKSALEQRRLQLAHDFALDAKFLKFTKKLTIESALLLPQRLPQCPMNGTEEEGNIIRHILSQGPEFTKFEKYKTTDRFAELVGLRKTQPLSTIGAYARSVDYIAPNDRDVLYNTLSSNKLTPIKTHQMNNNNDPNKNSLQHIVEAEKKKKVDLVDETRPRYVTLDLLPALHEVSHVEKMSNEIKAKEDEKKRKKQGLSNSNAIAQARAEMEAKIQSHTQAIESNTDLSEKKDDGMSMNIGFQRRKINEERQISMTRMFLQKPEVKYGVGRITSTHNIKGKIEEPWITVGGRYSVLQGDRTG